MPDIVLKNKDGEDVTYSGIETVTFDTPTQEKGATFTYGIAVENVPVELDLADGNQIISVPDGYLVKSGVIQKPETLLADNIKSGIEIAGVTGNFIGNALENIPIELDLADGNQVIQSPEGYLVKSAIIQKPETLLPENIAKDVEIAGVVGTFAGSTKLDDDILKYYSYQLDADNGQIILCGIAWRLLYADTGSYDVTIPAQICGYDVVIDSDFK